MPAADQPEVGELAFDRASEEGLTAAARDLNVDQANFRKQVRSLGIPSS